MPGQEFLQFITGVIKNKNPTSKLDHLLCAPLRSETSLCIPCHQVTCAFCLLSSTHSVPGVFWYKTKDQLKGKLAAIFHKIYLPLDSGRFAFEVLAPNIEVIKSIPNSLSLESKRQKATKNNEELTQKIL